MMNYVKLVDSVRTNITKLLLKKQKNNQKVPILSEIAFSSIVSLYLAEPNYENLKNLKIRIRFDLNSCKIRNFHRNCEKENRCLITP